ncbi:AzlC family ABC transporter permease [Halopiger djelfimassiliensis]|uniref:AzlC family ABC transporter permease n=1 Tax=Halopiger djelfimassiliensis TaxID=1293047 RepID=UPI0009DC0746|nr:AzlC family ABC transporter permease [Halopiger djelfimassiliensis]
MSDRQDDVEFGVRGVIAGVGESVPIAVSVFTYGITFGVLARQASLSFPEALLMSTTVFAASAQFVVLDMWESTLPIAAIIVTTGMVNLRHVLMGASLQPWLQNLPRTKVWSTLFFLNDESWGLTEQARARGQRDAAFLLGSGLIVFVGWVSATAIGMTAGALIADPARYGLDFAFVAVYIALLVGVWDGRPDAVPLLVAAGVSVAAAFTLPGNWYIVLGGCIGSFAGVARDSYG